MMFQDALVAGIKLGEHGPSFRVLGANPSHPLLSWTPTSLREQIAEVTQHTATLEAGSLAVEFRIRKERFQKLRLRASQNLGPGGLALKSLRQAHSIRQERPHRLGETRRKHPLFRQSPPNPAPRSCCGNPDLDAAQIDGAVREQNLRYLRSHRVCFLKKNCLRHRKHGYLFFRIFTIAIYYCCFIFV